MVNSKEKKNIIRWLLSAAVLAGLFVFCFFIHPQVVLDYDDWSYVSYSRIPIPWPSFWNPTRVLPELLMPLCGYAGALLYRLFPAMGYIRAETFSFAVMLSLMLFFYIGAFYHFLKKKTELSDVYALIPVAFFFLLHFLVFRTAAEGNSHLFRTANLTCCCFYLVPVLWNATAVMLFSSEPVLYGAFTEKSGIPVKVAALLLLYFGIFSNLYASILMAVFAGFQLLKAMLKKEKPAMILKKHRISLIILIFWFVSLLFEATGGRAGLADSELPFFEKLREVLHGSVTVLRSLNPLFAVLLIVFPVTAVVIARYGKKQGQTGIKKYAPDSTEQHTEKCRNKRVSPNLMNSSFVVLLCEPFLAAALISIYTVLLCAKVDPSYIQRPEVLLSIFSPLLLSVSISLAFLMKKIKNSGIWSILFVILIYVCTDTPGRTFSESYGIDAVITPETCIAISQDVVDQVIAAEKEGKTELTIDVSFNGDYCDNWPQCIYLQEALIPTLLKHGVISTEIKADIFPSMEFNAKYALDFPLLRNSTS